MDDHFVEHIASAPLWAVTHVTHASVLDAGTVCDEAVLVSLCVGRKGEPFCQQSPALPPYVVALHRAF